MNCLCYNLWLQLMGYSPPLKDSPTPPPPPPQKKKIKKAQPLENISLLNSSAPLILGGSYPAKP